ncbi:MAG: SOS response-associated peptidase [Saprospiraceae bacterium]|nr:SOS response-associated peptidase [Saprospiraceae bacterium]
MRLSSILFKDKLENTLGKVKLNASLIRSFNIMPGDLVSIITTEEGTVQRAKWGFKRSGSKTVIITTVEQANVHTKPSFRMAFRNRRCLLLIDSFYLWGHSDRVPCRFHHPENHMLFVPGIYDYDEEDKSYSCCAIMRRSRHSIEKFSPLEPTCIEPGSWKDWVADKKVDEVIRFLNQTSLQALDKYRVSNKLLIKGFNKSLLHDHITEVPSLF